MIYCDFLVYTNDLIIEHFNLYSNEKTYIFCIDCRLGINGIGA